MSLSVCFYLDNRVTMCDIHGISRGKLLPARSATKYLRKGMGAFVGNKTFQCLIY